MGLDDIIEKAIVTEDSGNDIRETAKKVTKGIVTEISGKDNNVIKPVINNVIGFMSAGSVDRKSVV